MAPFFYVVSEVEQHLYRWLVIIHRIIGFNVSRKLNAVANDLPSALNKGLLHVISGGVSHCSPESILDAAFSYANRMVYPVTTAFFISRILFT